MRSNIALNLDNIDYDHRHVVNLISAILLLSIGYLGAWTLLAIDRYETNQNCLASGRLECVLIYSGPKRFRDISLPTNN
jgi:hypothetical protein